MVKFLIVLFVIWLLARLAKRWILSKALRMQREMAEQLQAQMRSQMGAGMGAGMNAGVGAGTDDASAYTQTGHARAETGSVAERMVACAHCGLHIPQSEAVLQAGQTYCSLEHAQAHA